MALGYRENAKKLRSKNIVVYGMNDKDPETAREWIERENLPFAILLDVDRKVGISFGISDASLDRYVANNADGRRPAVAIDEFGRILAFEPDMKTVEEIDDLIERM
jgi:peroxiredoxin